MRLVVQRVVKAKVVRVSDNTVAGEIEKGLFVLVGFKKGDTVETIKLLADRLLKLRVMSDDSGKMNLTAKDTGGAFLIVSQFTLYANTSGGNRPSFVDAEDQKKAKKLYDQFVGIIQESGIKTETGSFGDYMKIDAVLDGPVTILYEN